MKECEPNNFVKQMLQNSDYNEPKMANVIHGLHNGRYTFSLFPLKQIISISFSTISYLRVLFRK